MATVELADGETMRHDGTEYTIDGVIVTDSEVLIYSDEDEDDEPGLTLDLGDVVEVLR